MSVTSYHKPLKRWLTSFGDDAAPGHILTWSVGHPLNGGEFTTIRLGAVVAHEAGGRPLFDEAETAVLLAGSSAPDGAEEGRVWATRAEIADAIEAAKAQYPAVVRLHGLTYTRNAFGGWRMGEGRP